MTPRHLSDWWHDAWGHWLAYRDINQNLIKAMGFIIPKALHEIS